MSNLTLPKKKNPYLYGYAWWCGYTKLPINGILNWVSGKEYYGWFTCLTATPKGIYRHEERRGNHRILFRPIALGLADYTQDHLPMDGEVLVYEGRDHGYARDAAQEHYDSIREANLY